jgi:hypothetical protein
MFGVLHTHTHTHTHTHSPRKHTRERSQTHHSMFRRLTWQDRMALDRERTMASIEQLRKTVRATRLRVSRVSIESSLGLSACPWRFARRPVSALSPRHCFMPYAHAHVLVQTKASAMVYGHNGAVVPVVPVEASKLPNHQCVLDARALTPSFSACRTHAHARTRTRTRAPFSRTQGCPHRVTGHAQATRRAQGAAPAS